MYRKYCISRARWLQEEQNREYVLNQPDVITEGLECIVCMTNVRNVIMQPCNHLCMCRLCYEIYNKKEECPVCRGNVESVTNIIIA